MSEEARETHSCPHCSKHSSWDARHKEATVDMQPGGAGDDSSSSCHPTVIKWAPSQNFLAELTGPWEIVINNSFKSSNLEELACYTATDNRNKMGKHMWLCDAEQMTYSSNPKFPHCKTERDNTILQGYITKTALGRCPPPRKTVPNPCS